jgi:hypothetical protein
MMTHLCKRLFYFVVFLSFSGTIFAQSLDTTSTFDDAPNSLTQPIQGFPVTPKREVIQMDILDFLSYAFVGRKVTVSKNQKPLFTGMVTRVYEKNSQFYADIFDLGKNRETIKLSFYCPKAFPKDISDRAGDYAEAKTRERMVVENKINTSELMQSSGMTIPNKSLRTPLRTIRQSVPYLDMSDNQTKNASFTIYRDALYLGNGQSILIKIEES